MKEPILFRRDDALSSEAAMYWKDLLYRTIKIGAEVETALPRGTRREDFEPQLNTALHPSGSLDNLGKYGVLDIIKEHCGVEIRVIGRHPYFSALVEQYQYIISELVKLRARTKHTCGLHFHVLTPSLAEPVPEIVLANVWNLTRRYAPHLRFLTSAGDKREAMCRRRQHNSHLEMVKLTPGARSMREIHQYLQKSEQVPEHQNFLNLEHITFDETGAVRDFHLEFRFPDADLSPTSLVAKTFLFLAMVLKSVEMSQYGVIHVGRYLEWKRKQELLDMLSNNDGNLAASDTSRVTDEVIEELREGCRELLDLLKPTLKRFEHNPSFEVLSLLAETPLSLMRISGKSWQEIETMLAERARAVPRVLNKVDKRLARCIELAEEEGQPSLAEWKQIVAWNLHLKPQELERKLDYLDSVRGLQWDEELGTLVFLT